MSQESLYDRLGGVFDAEGARRIAHPPIVLFEDSGDVLPLEPPPRFAQADLRRDARERAVNHMSLSCIERG